MLKQIYKKVIIVSLAIAFVTTLLHFSNVITFDLLNAFIGIAAGMLLTVVRLKLLNDDIQKIVENDKDIASKLGMSGYTKRYILTAIVLIGAFIYKIETGTLLVITLILATEIGVRLSSLHDTKKGGTDGE